jgi:hypothetical protein
MTERFLGHTEYFMSGDDNSITESFHRAVQLWIGGGLPPLKVQGAYEYLITHESPHIAQMPPGKSARLAVFMDSDIPNGPQIRAAVEINEKDFSIEELIDIVRAPGDNMSRGDHALLKLLLGRRKR